MQTEADIEQPVKDELAILFKDNQAPTEYEWHVDTCVVKIQTGTNTLALITFKMKSTILETGMRKALLAQPEALELPGTPPPGYHERILRNMVGTRMWNN